MPTATVGDLQVAHDRQGAGEPVLMINGIGAARGAWSLQLPAVSSRFDTITYDNRDVGETGASPSDERYGTDQFARDAIGLLDALEIEKAHIVGASMGGCIAQEVAIGFPERTASVTIICSWPNVEPWLDELWEQWEHLFRAQGPVAWSRTTWLWVFTHRAYAEPGFLDGLLTGAEDDPHPQTLEMYLRQSHAARMHDALDRLGQVAAPAHVICGEEDIFTPPRYSMEIANAIPGATFSMMPEVGHGMFWEATDAFNELVIGFIEQHPMG